MAEVLAVEVLWPRPGPDPCCSEDGLPLGAPHHDVTTNATHWECHPLGGSGGRGAETTESRDREELAGGIAGEE